MDICDTMGFFHRPDPDDANRRLKGTRWGVVYLCDQTEPTPTPPTA